MSAVRVDGAAGAVPAARTESVIRKAGAENFPVALRILPRRVRDDLMVIYAYARFVDDVGDLFDGDRVLELKRVEAEFELALAGKSSDPILGPAGELSTRFGIGRGPFLDLIEANRRDQSVTRYASYSDLEDYCALSANPVGRLVLAVFGVNEPKLVLLSDDVCTGLQLVEHWQDVAEDFRIGRLYLPSEDLSRFDVDDETIARASATPAFRRLMAFECARARRLLVESGYPLAASLTGWARVAISGFVGGGLAQLDAIEQRRYDVFSGLAKASRPSIFGHAANVWRNSPRTRS